MKADSRLSRRAFIRWTAGGLAAAALPCGLRALESFARSGGRRPNIVLFLVDDMGWQDTSEPFFAKRTPFNDRYRTPNMERLARRGVKFTQAYACCVCSPSRISLMTGMNAARHRVTNWTLRKNESSDAEHPTLSFPGWNVNGMSPEPGVPQTVRADALPRLLRAAGYATIHCGKAHFAAVGTPAADPRTIGFDVNIAGHAAGAPGSYLSEYEYSAAWRGGDRVWDVPGLEKYFDRHVFLTEALTREALAALEKPVAAGRPFFLYLAHYAVHVPIEEDPRFTARYKDMGLDPVEAKYAALVEGMDKSLGDVLDYLEKKGIADDTVVLFMSDNGGLSATGRGGAPHTHNLPLSSGKGSAREGGIREPMIVRGPGVAGGGRICDTPLLIEDFFPTILELAGIRDAKTIQTIDGKSFVPLLENRDGFPSDRPLFWHFPNCWGPSGPGIGASSTVRRGAWKLIYYHADRSFELFDLAADIGETKNLAAARPETVAELAGLLGRYLRSVGAAMPVEKATGKPVPWPDER